VPTDNRHDAVVPTRRGAVALPGRARGLPPLDDLLRGARFALSGGIVTLAYLCVTTGLAELSTVPFQVALAIGFATAIALHFSLQRLFVWRHTAGFALPLRAQLWRYAIVAGAQYAITAASTAVLPGELHVRTTYVYLATAILVTIANFLVLGSRVFHPETVG
jgi:putative flippase GtrA